MDSVVSRKKLLGPELSTLFVREQVSPFQDVALTQHKKRYESLRKHLKGTERVPINFWCVHDDLFVSGVPVEASSIRVLEQVFNVGLIVSCISAPLSRRRLFNCASHVEYHDRDETLLQGVGSDLKLLHLPILDADCPTSAQVQEFLAACKETRQKGKAVLVHCWKGLGRSWTLCCIFMRQLLNLSRDEVLSRFSPAAKLNACQLEYWHDDNLRFPLSPSHQHDLWTLSGQWFYLQNQRCPQESKESADHFLIARRSIYNALGEVEKLHPIVAPTDTEWEAEKLAILLRACCGDVNVMNEVRAYVLAHEQCLGTMHYPAEVRQQFATDNSPASNAHVARRSSRCRHVKMDEPRQKVKDRMVAVAVSVTVAIAIAIAIAIAFAVAGLCLAQSHISEEETAPVRATRESAKAYDEEALFKSIAHLEKSLELCTNPAGLLHVFPAFEAVVETIRETRDFDAIRGITGAFWDKARSLVSLLYESKSAQLALSASEREQLMNVEDWWRERPNLASRASGKMRYQLLDIVLQSSLAIPDYDQVMKVLKLNFWTRWEHQNGVIQSMLRTSDKQGWSMVFRHPVKTYSYQARRFLDWLEQRHWVALPGVEIRFSIDLIDTDKKYLQYSVMDIHLPEYRVDSGLPLGTSRLQSPSNMTLEWDMGFSFQSQVLQIKWSAYGDICTSASTCFEQPSKSTPYNIKFRNLFDLLERQLSMIWDNYRTMSMPISTQ